MKPLTKTTVNRGGGLAGQLVHAGKSRNAFNPDPKPDPPIWGRDVRPQPEMVAALKSILEVPEPDRRTHCPTCGKPIGQDRKAYMRKYQKDRRAKDKAAKAATQ